MHVEARLRDPGHPRRPGPRPADRRGRPADLPDLDLQAGRRRRHRAAATSTRAPATRRAPRWRTCLAALESGAAGARLRLRHGRRGLPAADALPAGRPRAHPQRRLRRHVPAVRQGAAATGACEYTPGRPDRPRRRRGPRSGPTTAADLGRDADQPAAVHRRHRARSPRSRTSTGALLVVDNTFASPYLQQPARPGRGRRRALDDEVPRRALRRRRRRAGRPATPRRADLALPPERARARCRARSTPGSPCAGIKTLAVRMDRHCANAARGRRGRSRRTRPWSHGALPGPAGHPGHEIAEAQMRDFGGMVSFRLRGGEAAAVERLRADRGCSPWASRSAASSR